MAKLPSQKLFNLIKSMSRAEKKTFTQLAHMNNKTRPPKYLRLFELLDKMPEFNEKKLVKSLSGITKNERSLAQMKIELYAKVLQSLRYHFDGNKTTPINIQLNILLTDIEILYRRALFDDAKMVLQQAKTMALNYGKYFYLPSLINWEKHLILRSGTDLNEQFTTIYNEENDVYQHIKIVAQLINANNKIIVINRQSGQDNTQKALAFDTQELLKKIDVTQLPIHAKIIYHETYATFYRVIANNMTKALKEYESLLQLLDQVPTTSLHTYTVTLSNIINCSLHLKKHHEVLQYLEKLKSLATKDQANEYQIYRIYSHTKMGAYITQGKFVEALPLVDEILEKLPFYTNKLDLITYYALLAQIFFGAEQYSKALDWVNCLLDEKDLQHRGDLLAFARMFNLIIHYELGNTFLLISAARSTARFLGHTDRKIYQSEKVILKTVKQLARSTDQAMRRNIYEQAYTTLQQLQQQTDEQTFYHYFDWLAWFKAKIARKSFAQVVQETYNT
jgi:tetratricopeptide (TPR) repeat protein